MKETSSFIFTVRITTGDVRNKNYLCINIVYVSECDEPKIFQEIKL